MILIPNETNVFNEEFVKRGGFLRCKAKGWAEWKNCLVSRVTAQEVIAMAIGGVGVTYIKIPAGDVSAGLWEIIYTNDLEETDHVEIDTEETP